MFELCREIGTCYGFSSLFFWRLSRRMALEALLRSTLTPTWPMNRRRLRWFLLTESPIRRSADGFFSVCELVRRPGLCHFRVGAEHSIGGVICGGEPGGLPGTASGGIKHCGVSNCGGRFALMGSFGQFTMASESRGENGQARRDGS